MAPKPHVDQIDRETLMQIQENLDINDDGKVTKAHTGTAPCTAHPSKPLRHAAAVGGRLCRTLRKRVAPSATRATASSAPHTPPAPPPAGPSV